MTGKLIVASEYVPIDGPLIFLAGPIQGADEWQNNAIDLIRAAAPDLSVASPRRSIRHFGEFIRDMYNEQVDWETHHLRRSAENGVILFWLAKESEHRCDRSYAQTTRFELAEWKVRHERDGAKMVVGLEDGFTGHKYIARRFSQDCPEVPMCNSLQDTCYQAIRLAKGL
jgi:hypothetical protein